VSEVVLDSRSEKTVRFYNEVDTGALALRRYHVVDGWHRIVAIQRLTEEFPDKEPIRPKV